MPPQIPSSLNLPVGKLSGSFRNVTNSYKFFWFLSILDRIQLGASERLRFDDLLISMVSRVWYPTNYFRLSFGKQDKLQSAAKLLMTETGISENASAEEIERVFQNLSNTSEAKKAILDKARFVPYRFLRPFVADQTRGIKDHQVDAKIKEVAATQFSSPSPPLYKFWEDGIQIHEAWIHYIQQHLEILQSFAHWHLLKFLQNKNPNCPNICSKLFAPSSRDLGNCKAFWKIAFEKVPDMKCVYSGLPLEIQNVSFDHFLPWSFVAHDLLWNLTPTTKELNSSKGNQLPLLDHYLRGFAKSQFRAVKAVLKDGPNKLVEDYLLLFARDVEGLSKIDEQEFSRKLEDTIEPQAQIAANMGFVEGWQYVQ
jgi:hypothetical protein